ATRLAVGSPQFLQDFNLSGQLLSNTALNGFVMRPAAGTASGNPGDDVVIADQPYELRIVHADGSFSLLSTCNPNRFFYINPTELVDLNRDGKAEILVEAWDNTNTTLRYLYAFYSDGTPVSAQFPIAVDSLGGIGSDGPIFTVFDGDGTGRPQIWVAASTGS